MRWTSWDTVSSMDSPGLVRIFRRTEASLGMTLNLEPPLRMVGETPCSGIRGVVGDAGNGATDAEDGVVGARDAGVAGMAACGEGDDVGDFLGGL